MQQEYEHGGAVDKISRQTGKKNLLDFSANINPKGLSKAVRQAIENNIDNVIHYPDVEMLELKSKISSIYNIAAEDIIVGNGAVELIYILCHVLQPQKVLLTAPAFSEYERAAQSVNAQITYCNLLEKNNFELSLASLIVALKEQDILFLCNPNNPTGTLLETQDLTMIVEHAEANGCFVVIDESFMDFIANSEEFSAKPLLKNNHNLFVLHSLTKFFALPGLRLGFGACHDQEVIKRMQLNKDPWNVNVLAQKAGLAALDDLNYQRRSRNYTRSEINYLYEELLELKKIKVYKPSVNYILINIEGSGMTAAEFKDKMLDKGIIIRDCSNYPGLSEFFIRVAVRTRDENDALLEAMEEILS